MSEKNSETRSLQNSNKVNESLRIKNPPTQSVTPPAKKPAK
jgi:hypothetical protein|uniref:Uncharacterized protein n=1 Tax=Siphoviridae sp. ct5jB2 TaxID=2825337 RepID=A0A8S5TTP0_9CAUD|nr:MAG TPA: hypothetical protein [Siphoviridae sp. ct5jB2]